MHVAGSDVVGVHPGLLANEGLYGLVTLTGNAIEAHQVAEDDVIAITAIDRVGTRQGGLGVAEDGIGQVLRIDVGLRLVIGVVRNQVGRLDGLVQADRLDLR